MPGTVLGDGVAVVNKIDKALPSCNGHSSGVEADSIYM